MPKLSDHKTGESKYLKSGDLPEGKEAMLTMSHCQEEIIERSDGSGEQKFVLYFHGREKGLVLNNTNIDTLIEGFGDDTNAVTGQQIILYRTTTKYKGETVPCLRLRLALPTAKDEEIPF